jgi:Zn-dependent protease
VLKNDKINKLRIKRKVIMLFNFSLATLIVIVPVVLISITIHELAHGLVADRFGDPTPKRTGRLTLNPIKHLDPMGAILLALVGFGWAKPVQVNPYNFNGIDKGYDIYDQNGKNYSIQKEIRKKMMYVALAGPASNILLAIIAATVYLHFDFLFTSFPEISSTFFQTLIMINVFLASFNMLPIPPLDGSKVLGAFLSEGAYQKYMLIEDKGFLILMLLIITGATQYVIRPIAGFFINFVYFIATLGYSI